LPKQLGLRGLAWAKMPKGGKRKRILAVLSHSFSRRCGIDSINSKLSVQDGDLLLIAAGSYDVVKLLWAQSEISWAKN